MILMEKTFENIVGKEENAGNQHFLLFQQSFLPDIRPIESGFLCSGLSTVLDVNKFNPLPDDKF